MEKEINFKFSCITHPIQVINQVERFPSKSYEILMFCAIFDIP